MSGNKSQNNFVMQAGILAAAGIISRIIGLLYRGPLNSIIGPLGLGYYQAAYVYYTIVLLISSYSIPSAISKVIAQKLAVKEYRNAHRIFLCAMGYVLSVGGIASIFLFLGAGLFVQKEAVPVLRVLAPTIFVYGMLGVLRGYFQAHKSMVQTSVSQILEQIVNAAVSIGCASLFIKTFVEAVPEGAGEAVTAAGESGRIDRAVYGAMGSAVGTGAGVAVALLFILFIYLLNRKMIHRRIERDRHENVDSYGHILKMITAVVAPFILSTAVYNLCAPVNNYVYCKLLPALQEMDGVLVSHNFGIFDGQSRVISNIPIAFASAMASAMIPSVSQLVAAQNLEGAREKIGVAIKSTMVISIPSAVGLFVLARPITNLLFSNSEDDLALSARILMALALSVVFYALSTLSSSILQGMGKVNVPIVNSAVALVLQTAVLAVLLWFTRLDIYSLAIANTVYAVAVSILNQISVRKAVEYKQEWSKSFFIPLLASAFMGASAWAVYELLYLFTESMRISVIPALVVAVAVYFVMMILLRGLTEEELRGFPKGYLLVKVAKKCHLMK